MGFVCFLLQRDELHYLPTAETSHHSKDRATGMACCEESRMYSSRIRAREYMPALEELGRRGAAGLCVGVPCIANFRALVGLPKEHLSDHHYVSGGQF